MLHTMYYIPAHTHTRLLKYNTLHNGKSLIARPNFPRPPDSSSISRDYPSLCSSARIFRILKILGSYNYNILIYILYTTILLYLLHTKIYHYMLLLYSVLYILPYTVTLLLSTTISSILYYEATYTMTYYYTI